jgi:hypothetical protein
MELIRANNEFAYDAAGSLRATSAQNAAAEEAARRVMPGRDGGELPPDQSAAHAEEVDLTKAVPNPEPTPGHIAYLKMRPETWREFELKFGRGSAARYLGKQQK